MHSYGAITIEENDKERELHMKSLHKHQEASDRVTIIANALNALLGVALFAMPWGFQQSGVAGGTAVLIFVALLSYETARMLLEAQKVLFLQTGEVKGYPEIACAALGNVWYYVVQITTVISCLGGCTGYIIFFGQTLGQAFSLPAETVILAATAPLVFLSWIRSFQELTLVTIFGVAALVLSVVILLIDGSGNVEQVQATPLVQPLTIFNFVGSATFLFTIHYCVLSMGAENLRSKPWLANSRSDGTSHTAFVALERAIGTSYILAFVIILVVGSGGYIMYRNAPLVRYGYPNWNCSVGNRSLTCSVNRDHLGGIVGGCEEPVCQNVILNIAPGMLR
jgi:amino acid permease